MGADTLAHVLRPLTALFSTDAPDVLVGLSAPDDAAVYRLNDDLTLLATVDFFPPIVDDPATFGAVAVTNALSDIYAMGGQPLFALNIVGFPADLDQAILSEILRGGAEQARRAGIAIVGGHSVIDAEPKYGLAVIGTAHPDAIITKGGAREGDALVLTKPLGTGIITTALKRDLITEESQEMIGAVQSMLALNAAPLAVLRAAREAGSVTIHAGTDVTGFGLLGHAREMIAASPGEPGLRIVAADLPALPGARGLAARGVAPGGADRNRTALEGCVRWGGEVADADRALAIDPQTSGGLLVAVPGDQAGTLIAALTAAGVAAWRVAEVTDSGDIEVM